MSHPIHAYLHTLSLELSPDAKKAFALLSELANSVPEKFLDALFIAFQSEKGRAGFSEDLKWCAGLCRATWREEALWNGLVHVRRGPQKRTHLMYAAWLGDAERVRWLLARGAPVDLKDSFGRQAINFAGIRGSIEVVKTLLAAGADVNAASELRYTPLHCAVINHRGVEVVKFLLSNGATVDAASSEGWTALHQASFHGQLEVVRALLAAGANVNILTTTAWTPLHKAAENGHVEIIRVLHAAGANATLLNADGETARHVLNTYKPKWPLP